MALAKSLKNSVQKYSGRVCAAVKIVNRYSLSEEDAKTYLEVLNNADPYDISFLPANQLVKVAAEEGIIVSNSSINRHREKSCTCYTRTKAGK